MGGAHGQDPGTEGQASQSLFGAIPPDDDPPRQMSKEEWERATQGDIDPAKYAGEGWGATEEYFPQDIDNPYTRGDVTGEGEYYPGPDPKKRKWPPYRGQE